MDLKSNLQLMSEAAISDIQAATSMNLELDTVREAFELIPEAPEPVVTEAADVLVTQMSTGEYYVEFANLAPFMNDAGITNIAEALDLVAEVYGLPKKSIGLIVESAEKVDTILETAKSKAKKTGNQKVAKNAVVKVDKTNKVAKSLMENGYKVARKSKDSAVCSKCGKVISKCTCKDDAGKKVKKIREATEPAGGNDPHDPGTDSSVTKTIDKAIANQGTQSKTECGPAGSPAKPGDAMKPGKVGSI